MQVIGVLLTKHVLNNYARFVQGIDDIASLQDELQGTLLKVKEGRSFVQHTARSTAISLEICRDSKTKQQLGGLLDVLERIQSTKDLDVSLR